MGTGRIISVVNRPAGTDNHARKRPFPHAPLRQPRLSRPAGRGVQQEGAFCISGRCFDGGVAEKVARLSNRADHAPNTSARARESLAVCTSPCGNRDAGWSPAATIKASSTSGRKLTQRMGQCRGRTHVPMALCQPRRRELSAGIATNRQADRFTRMAHDTGAWKSNVDAQRAVVPQHSGMAEGTIGSLGAELRPDRCSLMSRQPR